MKIKVELESEDEDFTSESKENLEVVLKNCKREFNTDEKIFVKRIKLEPLQCDNDENIEINTYGNSTSTNYTNGSYIWSNSGYKSEIDCKKERIKEEICDTKYDIKSECKVVLRRLNIKVKTEDCEVVHLRDEYQDVKPVKNEFFTSDESFNRNETNVQIDEKQSKEYDIQQNSNREKHYKNIINKKKYIPSIRKCNQVQKMIKRKYSRVMPASVSKQKFTCDLCKQTFINKEILEAHLFFHIRKKRFHCTSCNEKFSWQFLLQRHMKKHKNENQVVMQSSSKYCKESNIQGKICQSDISDKCLRSKYRLETNKRKHIPHRCKICKKEFKFESYLRVHKVTHSKNRLFKCDICNKYYKTKRCLKKHYELHTDQYNYSCEICNKHFKTKRYLNHHKRVVHINDFIHCQICNKSFKSKLSLKQHSVTHSNEYKYSCDVCNKHFKTKSCLRKHEILHKDRIKYLCDICNASFNNKPAFLRHRLVEHEKMFVCKYCNKSFKTENMMTAHCKIHIQRCNVCNKEFKDKRCFISHQKSHFDIKPLVCEVCKKHFCSKKILLKHERIHLKKRYPCINCKISFETENKLKCHLKVCRLKIDWNQFPYQCGICKQTYNKKSSFMRHLITYNNKIHFCCDICKRKFTTEHEYQSHQELAHPTGGKHQCEICKRTFQSNYLLNFHMQRNTDLSVKNCDVCDKNFCSDRALKIHMRSHLLQ
ncbi:oocyte zinc finger protein XlCOF6-like [Centruroides sculpturatus]|uniref:oocyte zinc finger protein XlCOF6-like n=1 Tax=Centruroides sculpturatus TaxID=218467 RepID=UPI000C6CD716|nr:oocyte zinc finger protein XlCOF6-like [Centruroides sculpturatus]